MADQDLQNFNKRSLKAASWYTVSNFVAKCIIYFLTPLYTRLLTHGEYGQYQNWLSWQIILISAISLDMAATVALGYLEYKDKREFESFISSITLVSLAIPLAICLAAWSFRVQLAPLLEMNLPLFSLLLASLSFTNVLNIFQAEQRTTLRYKTSSVITLAVASASSLFSLALPFLLPDKLFAVLLGNVGVNVAANLILYAVVFRRSFCIRWRYIRYALAISLPLIPHMVAGHILGSSDKVMITELCGSAATALYSLPFICSMVVTLLVTSINGAWTPWFFNRLWEEDLASIRKVVRVTLPLFTMAALAVCLIGPEVVWLMGGSSYLPAVAIMPPIILSCACHYLYTLYVNIEFYNKKTFYISVATVITALANVALNYIFIRKFGYRAAAYTTLFCRYMLLAIHIFIVKRQGMLHVFENRYNFFMLLLMTATCMASLLFYPYPVLRCTLFALYMVFLVILAARRKKQLLQVLHYFRK